jgi:hypothetical protein
LDLNVWLLHIAMMIAGAAILLFIEATGNYVRCGGENGGAAADDVSGTIREDNEPTPNFSLNGLIKGVWAAFMHFLWNGPKHDPRTPMGKLALFALSFHTLIIAASYTASLAGFLATSSTVPIEVSSDSSPDSHMPISPIQHCSVLARNPRHRKNPA